MADQPAAPSNTVRAPAHIKSLLARLHSESATQEAAIDPKEQASIRDLTNRDPATGFAAFDDLMRDKFIALDADKAEFVYQLIVSSRASYVVEAGTSFGVSTIYWALAVAEVEKLSGRKGLVVGTEKEETKAEVARKHWSTCGPEVESHIDLRVGDLEETLKTGLSDVDFLVLDSEFWMPCMRHTHFTDQISLAACCLCGIQSHIAETEARCYHRGG